MKKYFESYRTTAEKLISDVENYSEAEFATKPDDEQWSLGQMYNHIALVTKQCLLNIDLCSQKKGKRLVFAFGPALFSLMGSFPPIKIHIKKIPESVAHLYAPVHINRSDAKHVLQESVKKMENYILILEGIDKAQRIEHWAGGWFTATQWYHSAEMHIRHHLRQKKRINVFIKKL